MTNGFSSYAAFSPQLKAGVMILSNSAWTFWDTLGNGLLNMVADQ